MRIPFSKSRNVATPFAVLGAMVALVLAGCSSPSVDKAEGDAADDAAASPAAEEPGEYSTADSGTAAVEGVTDDDVAAAEEIVAAMEEDELVGSVVMMTFHGTDVGAAADVISERHLAGAIVMGYNLPDSASAEDVRGITDVLAGAAGDRGWPVTIGVDQEGGPVARLDGAALDFPPLMAAGAAGDADITRAAIEAQSEDLRNLGFTGDFAPVADLTIGADDPVINLRSSGDDPARVSAVVGAAVAGYTSTGLTSSAKHFPGHGALTVDSHEELPVSEQTLEELAEDSYAPFRAAAEAAVPMVLIGHIGLPGAEDTPATFNPDVYDSLRDDVGFEGVAVTDALNMGAVAEEPGQETVRAIAAGADLALMPPNSADAVTALAQALDSGELPRERVVEAATRVVAMQLWHARVAGDEGAEGSESAEEALTALADASLTVLAGECTFADPAESIALTGGSAAARAAMTEAAEEAGLTVEGENGSGEESDDAVTVSMGDGPGADSSDVVVGTSGPWNVDDVSADTVVEVYDTNPYALTAVAKYLAGDLAATGSVPVEVSRDVPDCG